MRKQKILLLIPLAIIAVLLSYTWVIILTTDFAATWRHYLGLLFYIFIGFTFIRNFKVAVISTAIFLLLATINLLAIRNTIVTSSFGFNLGSGSLKTPPIQMLSFGILIVFCILNLDTMISYYLDYKESKEGKKEV